MFTATTVRNNLESVIFSGCFLLSIYLLKKVSPLETNKGLANNAYLDSIYIFNRNAKKPFSTAPTFNFRDEFLIITPLYSTCGAFEHFFVNLPLTVLDLSIEMYFLFSFCYCALLMLEEKGRKPKHLGSRFTVPTATSVQFKGRHKQNPSLKKWLAVVSKTH